VNGAYGITPDAVPPESKDRSPELSPFRQGDLDCLCGIYSLINSARLVDPSLNKRVCRAMFRDALQWLIQEGLFQEAVMRGISVNKLMSLHKHIIRIRRARLRLSRPFLRHKPESEETFWQVLSALSVLPENALLVGIATRSWSHWTVVRGISQGWIYLLDSENRIRLRQSLCVCSWDRPGMYVLSPAEVFLISRGRAKSRDKGGILLS
jgi:hypothetical protein